MTQPGPDIVSGTSGRPEVALTFDGRGEAEITRSVLRSCAAAGAGITVFAVGIWAEEHPDLAREIVAAGHDLGNHTWSHQNLGSLSLAAATEEIRKGADALVRAVGSKGWFFRPSQTESSTPTIRQAAIAAGYARCISYGVDPLDYSDPGAATVRSRVRAGLKPGAIVSLHLGHPGTAEAMPGLLGDIKTAGLSAVTLSRLLI